MMIIRPIKESDTDAFIAMIMERGKGLTSLPKNPEFLKLKILNSLELFKSDEAKAGMTYLFVMEDLNSKELTGTCGIIPRTGGEHPCYFYKLTEEIRSTANPDQKEPYLLLEPTAYHIGPSELCGLYLKKNWRHSSFGKLLSLSRFLFIATFRDFFEEQIIAEMRGFVDKNGNYPFWEKFGKLLFNAPREEALKILNQSKHRVHELLPRHPVYIRLLHEEVILSLSEVHEKTKPALKMLNQQGFTFSNEIDIIDGGPKVIAETNKVQLIRDSRSIKVKMITPPIEEPHIHLIANEKKDFRACYGTIDEQGGLPENLSKALNVNVGDTVRVVKKP